MGPRLVMVNDVGKDGVQNLLRILRETRYCLEARVLPCGVHALSTNEDHPAAPPALPAELAQVQFKVKPQYLSDVIKALQRGGFETFDVLDVASSTERLSSERRAKERSWFGTRFGSTRNRLSTLEIHNNIVGSSHLTFDHLILIFMASCFAAIGLLGDSPVNILASFFVSPLMNMILATTWGVTIQDHALVSRGLRNMAVGGVSAFGVGILIGGILGFHGKAEMLVSTLRSGHGVYNHITVNSKEIMARGPPASYSLGNTAIVAMFSGITIALGQSTGVSNALSGVTLAASLLPPLVNSGLLVSLGFAFPDLRLPPDVDDEDSHTLHEIAVVSFCIYCVTVSFVPTFAFLTFKAKHIGGKSFRLAALSAPRPSVPAIMAEPLIGEQAAEASAGVCRRSVTSGSGGEGEVLELSFMQPRPAPPSSRAHGKRPSEPASPPPP